MSNQYDPSKDLELYHNVGTAQCVSLSDNFAVVEDFGTLTASQFQVMLEGDWILAHQPVVTETNPVNGKIVKVQYTFTKIIQD